MNFTAALIAITMLPVALRAAEDLMIADFEGQAYAPWQATGTAFGQGPARGALRGQMHVEGFRGQGLVNSFFNGDDTTGTLTSPPLKLERKYLTFLIGGGGFARETCLNLRIAGKVVRTATGPNTEPGGSEALSAHAWDVGEFSGQEAVMEIVDARKGGWGHINVDHIMQTDDKGATPLAALPEPPPVEITRTLKIDAAFLQLPVVGREDRNRKGLEKFSIELDGKVVRYLNVDLAHAGETPTAVYSYDLREFKGREITLRYRSPERDALEKLVLNNSEYRDAQAYAGRQRPQFHFSPRLGWMNDINGTYWHDGLWHVFYQFNPTNRGSGAGFDMHWGHSVSKDLVHWEEWPVALFPNAAGQCYSGTTIVTKGALPPLTTKSAPVIFFSGTAPFAQHIATTTDDGKTWQRFAGNPVIKNMGDGDRDPKVVWHEASQHYCMVLYVGGPDTYRFLRSKDHVNWEQTQSIPGWFECPEFFPVKSAVTGEDLWLLYGCYRTGKDAPKPFHSNSCYQLGRFDGQTFSPVGDIKHAHEGPNFYGALIFNNAPQGRNIMMGWTRGTALPQGEKFNQHASVPLEMTVRNIGKADTLCFEPVKELEALRGQPLVSLKNTTLAAPREKLAALGNAAELDVVIRFRPAAGPVNFKIRGATVSYDPAAKKVVFEKFVTELQPAAAVDARFLIDRTLCETFWNTGEAAYCFGTKLEYTGQSLFIEGEAEVEELTVYPMRSIWKP
jgi:fructan beta-fructosidase